jgi:BirA family biotin operon repressor/biotin-[acetyl-CoA-carboxylase] ligase
VRILVHRFESVSSTNDVAVGMAEEGAPEGTVVIALEQTAGKGRYGRHWVSPAGGLYLSIILRPDVPFDKLWQTAFVSSLAACEAIGEVSGLDARIKWPNDVLLNGRKVCGILVEARGTSVQGSRFKVQSSRFKVRGSISAVVGIGANVNNEAFPAEIAETATSIALEVGHPISMAKAEESLLSRLGARYEHYVQDGFDPILEAWRILDCTAGRRVEVNTPEGLVAGTALEVDSSGDLILQRDDGSTARITAGDVILRDA